MNCSGWRSAGPAGNPALILILALIPILAWVACGEAPPAVEVSADSLRAQAAGHFANSRFEQAQAALAPLVARPTPDGEDLVRAAAVAAANASTADPLAFIARARKHLDGAAALRPDDPQIPYLRGHLAKDDLDYEAAAGFYQRALELEPQDGATRILLAEVYEQLGRVDDAEALFVAVRERGLHHGSSLYATATFMLSRIYFRQSRQDPDMFARGEALQAEHKLLETQDIKSIDTATMRRSNLGAVRPPKAPGLAGGKIASGPQPTFEVSRKFEGVSLAFHRPIIVGPDEQTALLVARIESEESELTLSLLKRGPDASWSETHLETPSGALIRLLAAGDVDDSTATTSEDDQEQAPSLHNPAEELLFIAGPQRNLRLMGLRADLGGLEEIDHGIDAALVGGAVFSDFDHDGDLDIVTGGASGLQFWRNDGATDRSKRTFTEVPEAQQVGWMTSVVAGDFDGDQDVDYITLNNHHRVLLHSNLRGGRFEDVSEAWGLQDLSLAIVVQAADLDGDGRPDLIVRSGSVPSGPDSELPLGTWMPAPRTQWHRNLGDRFAAGVDLLPPGSFVWWMQLADIDLDGHVDLVGNLITQESETAPPGAFMIRGPVTAPGAVLEMMGPITGTGKGNGSLIDLDGDLDLDLLLNDPPSADGGINLFTNTGPTGNGLRYVLRGKKDNTHGVGAILEARVGDAYRRIYWDGSPQVLGLGEQDAPDYVIVTWPNGVVQYDPHIDTKDNQPFEQPEGAAGSCPFLYTWNGETYEFIFDVLGATPLGLPMGPGQLVPFNHHEYSKIDGHKLAPDEHGKLKLVLTEELREVTYLDRARLEAVDHPSNVEVQPNEAFQLPPYPEHHLHTLRDVVPVARVIHHDGFDGANTAASVDVTKLTAVLDGREAREWTSLPAQFPGIAEPWSLELVLAETEAQRAELARAPKVRLMLTGWLQWAEASTNMALAYHPTHSFELPALSVPDPSSPNGWRRIDPPIGFPAGKTRTQIVDITELVNLDDPRLLFTTTQKLSWDRIALALDADDFMVRRTALEPSASRVTFRGFSKRLFDVGPAGDIASAQERFDWDQQDLPRWDQHPGMYTKYGEVTPLLEATDDMYVIFGAGDAVYVEFDAAGLPPLPAGWTRDWLLYLDGWAKDRDPNTIAAEEVQPLPFHAMSSYPPPPVEAYPDTPEHNAYRDHWNTRPGRTLIVPLTVSR